MNLNLRNLAARAAPAIFVVLWSTGFIATKYVLHNAEPMTYLAIRMALVVGLMAVIVAIARPKWPDSTGIAHSVVSGILVHGFYRSAATSVASERLDTVAIAGMVACAAAVFLVNRRA